MLVGSIGGFTVGGGGGALVAALTGGAAIPAVPAAAWAGAGAGATGGLAVGKAITGLFFSSEDGNGRSGGGREGAQDKQLTRGDIRRLQDAGEDIHRIKADALGTTKNLSRFDLFKTRTGEIVVKLKGGGGEPHPTGLNIKDF